MAEMSAAFRDAYPAGGAPVLVVGGPRFDPSAAGDLGVDAIFGRGTTPREVASYLAATLGPEPSRRMPSPAGAAAGAGPAAVGAVGAAPAPGAADAKDPQLGLSVTHRRYVRYGDAHYGGNLVDGAYALALFGDVATEVCIRMDGDEGLFASYADVQFRAPVQAGDIIEATAAVTAVGRRSRELTFEASVVCRADPARGPSAAAVLPEPLVVATATGTVVVPAAASGGLPGPVSSAATGTESDYSGNRRRLSRAGRAHLGIRKVTISGVDIARMRGKFLHTVQHRAGQPEGSRPVMIWPAPGGPLHPAVPAPGVAAPGVAAPRRDSARRDSARRDSARRDSARRDCGAATRNRLDGGLGLGGGPGAQ